MATTLPFRPYVRPTPRGKSGERAYRDLMRVHAGDHQRDPDFLRHVATEAPEVVALGLLLKEREAFAETRWHWRSPDEPEHWTRVAARLLTERASRDLQSEDVSWTPLVDALFLCNAWEADSAVVGLHEITTDLKDWVRSITKPADLDRLLTFKASTVLEIAAEHAPRLTWRQIDQLTEDTDAIRALSRNAEAVRPHARRLILKGWSVWRNSSGNRTDPHFYTRQAWLLLFTTLVENGARLPRDARIELLDEAERPISTEWNAERTQETRMAAIAAVAADPGVQPADLARLAMLRPQGAALRSMMLAKHMTLEMAERLLDPFTEDLDDEVAIAFLRRFQDAPAQRIASLVRAVRYPAAEFVRLVVDHPNADERAWLEFFNSDTGTPAGYTVVNTLIDTPRCVASAAVREQLCAAANWSALLTKLLTYAEGAEEWRRIFVRLAEVDPHSAAEELAPERMRPDVRLNHADLMPLLTSEIAEVRLAALCALPSGQPVGSETLTADSPKLRR